MNQRKTVFAALLTMLLWGSLFPAVKLGFRAYGVDGLGDLLLFAGLRFLICGGIISLFSLGKEPKAFLAVKGNLFPLCLSGLFAIILHYGFTYLALEFTDSSKTALVKQVGALFYVCFSFLFFRQDRPTVRKILAAVMGFLGILALDWNAGGISFSLANLPILAASFCTVFANVIGKKLLQTLSPMVYTGLSQLFGGGVLAALGLALGGRVDFPRNASLGIMAYICFASTLSYTLWYRIVQRENLSKLFVIKFSEPIFACLFSALLLGEEIFRWQTLVSLLLIASAILLIHAKEKPRRTS